MLNKRGPRPGRPDTSAQILEAARGRFLASGYRGTTLRAVAADANVDVALIPYYFGSKQGLFGAAMTLRLNPAAVLNAVLEGDVETLPERLVGGLLRTWDDPEAGPPLQALIREAMHDPAVGAAVREYIEREVVDRLAQRLPGPDRTARAIGIATQMAGLITTRYLLQLEPIARMPAAELAQAVLPALRKLILPTPRRRR